MRVTIQRGVALALSSLSCAHVAAGQSVGQVNVGYVADAFYETPGGAGLLATAVAEAEIAEQHAELANRDPYDLQGMKRHALHVLHAVDPSLVQGGPGLGYGVRRAALGIAQQIEIAAGLEDASYNLRTHARYIAGAARSVVARAERMVTLVERIESLNEASAAWAPVMELEAEAQALFAGSDTDGDGHVGWSDPEGGLRQIQQHLTLLRRGEETSLGGLEP